MSSTRSGRASEESSNDAGEEPGQNRRVLARTPANDLIEQIRQKRRRIAAGSLLISVGRLGIVLKTVFPPGIAAADPVVFRTFMPETRTRGANPAQARA